MKTFAKCLVLICGVVLWSVAFSFSQSTKTVAYPEGYRRWTHIKSSIIGSESPAFKRFGGLHHIYANPHAMEGYKTGRFPDGSILVFDLLEVQTKNGETTEGARRFINVIQKDAKRFAETGGWGFEEFRGDSHMERTLNEQAATACFTCHAAQKERDFVFSSFRE